MRKFAISDIHGCLKTFEALLDQIQFTTQDELYLLGDYIDRGPDSKGVIDLIWKMQADGYQVKCLRG
ncbi:MAG: metallophosphoesterase, partial [Bacteroidota bacterium]